MLEAHSSKLKAFSMFDYFMEWGTYLVEKFGYLGIFLFTFTESFIQPVPPDPFIVGATSLGLSTDMTVLVVCVATVLGAVFGYGLGKVLGKPIFVKIFGKKSFKAGKKFFAKYGVWGIVIAGLTPIPFKITTWLAGIYNLPFHKFLIASIVGRVPRFVFMAYLGDVLRRMWM